MRIGILTLPLHINYGGILQAYALQTVLERLGHEVSVFDKILEPAHIPCWKKPLSYAKRVIWRYILGRRNVEIFAERNAYRRRRSLRHFTQPFIEWNIHRYAIRHLSDIRRADFDAIVVGSDQIWRMRYFKGLWEEKNGADAFLAFTKGWNIRRVAYAASFGLDNPDIANEELEECREALTSFDAISVREESGREAVLRLFKLQAEWMLDPTLLLQRGDYIELVGERERTEQHQILMSYVLDDNDDISTLRDSIAQEKHLMVRLTNVSTNSRTPKEIQSQPPLENWLRSFVEAEYVITDSFHACVFSIIFHKQFTVIANEGRGVARFQSLLKFFGLESRMIMTPQEYRPMPNIDYAEVEAILCEKRQTCLQYLRSSLDERL